MPSDSVTVSRTVAAPVETVWAVATDLAAAPETLSGVTRVEVLEGEIFGVGTRWRETRTLMVREATEEPVVTAATAPSSYTVEADNHGVHYVSTFAFAPLGANRTEVTMAFAGTPTAPQNPLVKLMGRFGLRMVRKTLEQDLADLARAAEARAARG